VAIDAEYEVQPSWKISQLKQGIDESDLHGGNPIPPEFQRLVYISL